MFGETYFRAVVHTDPRVIYSAQEDVMVLLHVPANKPDGTENPLVFVQPVVKPAQPYSGLPLPFDTQFKLYLRKGEDLWALSVSESLVAGVVYPFNGGA
jgi:hypothetical protein